MVNKKELIKSIVKNSIGKINLNKDDNLNHNIMILRSILKNDIEKKEEKLSLKEKKEHDNFRSSIRSDLSSIILENCMKSQNRSFTVYKKLLQIITLSSFVFIISNIGLNLRGLTAFYELLLVVSAGNVKQLFLDASKLNFNLITNIEESATQYTITSINYKNENLNLDISIDQKLDAVDDIQLSEIIVLLKNLDRIKKELPLFYEELSNKISPYSEEISQEKLENDIKEYWKDLNVRKLLREIISIGGLSGIFYTIYKVDNSLPSNILDFLKNIPLLGNNISRIDTSYTKNLNDYNLGIKQTFNSLQIDNLDKFLQVYSDISKILLIVLNSQAQIICLPSLIGEYNKKLGDDFKKCKSQGKGDLECIISIFINNFPQMIFEIGRLNNFYKDDYGKIKNDIWKSEN